MNLNEHKLHLDSLIEMELKGAEPVTGDALQKLQFILQLDYIPHIFYNDTNIILTDRDEYEKLKTIVKKFEDVLKIELNQFNMNLFIGNYINCPELITILGK